MKRMRSMSGGGHGGQGESLVPPHTRRSVSLPLSSGGGQGETWCLLYTWKRLCLGLGPATKRSLYCAHVGCSAGGSPASMYRRRS